jgi:hypothetical protein
MRLQAVSERGTEIHTSSGLLNSLFKHAILNKDVRRGDERGNSGWGSGAKGGYGYP